MSGRYQPDEHEMDAIRREVMEFAGIGLYRYAFDGTLIFIDRGALRIFDLDKEYPDPSVLAGRSIEELIVYVGLPGAIRRELRQKRRTRDYEYPFKTLSGKMKWVLHDSYLITDPTTGEEVIQAIIRDITDRKMAEDALRQAEERYRSIFENAGIGIFQATPEGQLININAAYAHIFGYDSPQEMIAAVHDVAKQLYVDPVHRDEIVQYVLSHPGIARFDNQYRHRDGHIITANLILRAVYPKSRPPYLEGFIEDITERKEAREALEKERAFLSSTIDVLPLPIFFIAQDEQLMRMNSACRRFFSKYQILAWDDITWLSADTHAPIPREQWPITRTLQHGEVVSAAEGILVPPDGQEVPLLLYTAPIYVGEEVVAAVMAFQDISALKAADRAKTEFLNVLSHELKTPLTSILGWTQMAEDEPDIGIVREALHVIERNARRQRQILDDLIDVSRLVYGRLVIKPEETDLWVQAVQADAEIEQEAREHHVEIALTPPGVELPVFIDALRIRQALGDLLGNAIKFSATGGVVTLTGSREDKWAVLTIHDTGRGIPADQLATLFKPFQQVQRSELTGGLGLGLALVRGIIELHGGRISAASPGPELGSTFTVRLPLRKKE